MISCSIDIAGTRERQVFGCHVVETKPKLKMSERYSLPTKRLLGTLAFVADRNVLGSSDDDRFNNWRL